MLGDGDGTFRPEMDSPLGEGQVEDVKFADLNKDGVLDLVSLNASPFHGSGSISIALGDGQGKFETSGSPLDVGVFFVGPMDFALSDMNSDGSPDLLISYFSGGIDLRLGDGKGGFGPGQFIASTGDSLPNKLLVGDLNHDDRPDLIAADGNGTLTWLLDATNTTPMKLNFVGIPGRTYRIDYASTLTNPPWTPVITRTAGPDGRFQTFHQSAGRQAYYRTVEITKP
jgi:hypothetical protein